VGTAIGVNDGPVFGIDHRLDGRIQHRVDEFSVRARTERPADDHAVEAVDQGRQIHLASWDLELRDVSEPLLVGRGSPEVSIEKVVWRRADLSQV